MKILVPLFRCHCLLAALALAAVEPVFHEGFDDGKLAGPVGQAGNRFNLDARGMVDLDRGTLAFFHQSAAEPEEGEWGGPGGVTAGRDSGYWSMLAMFQTRRTEFMFNFYDIGFYAPPLKMPSIIGRWQAGQWHHLAAVWDRANGITVYEDGKRVNSNWGKYHWYWSGMAEKLGLAGPVDEVYLFADCLTDAQIAELAAGKAPSGAPLQVPAQTDRDLARYGWDAASLAVLPTVSPQAPLSLTFARISETVDALRPVSYLHGGLTRVTWPSHKYGPSTRGQELSIKLADETTFNYVGFLSHRDFAGRLVAGDFELPVSVPHAKFLYAQTTAPVTTRELVLRRDYGQVGYLALFRAQPLAPGAPQGRWAAYNFAAAAAFPDLEAARIAMAETPRRFWNPVTLTQAAAPAWSLATPAFGGFQAIMEPPNGARAATGVRLQLSVAELPGPTPLHIEIKEPVDSERAWLIADVVLVPNGAAEQTFTLQLEGRPVINLPSMIERKGNRDGSYDDSARTVLPGVGCSLLVTAGQPMTWRFGDGGTQFQLLLADPTAAVEAAAEDQTEWLREAYADAMEGHAYSWHRLQLPLRWLACFAPEGIKFRQMWERCDSGRDRFVDHPVEPLVYVEPANETGAPDWAFWQLQAMNLHRRHVHWIIDHKQTWTGEYGGLWNDDSTHVENWVGYTLCLDDERKITESLRRYWSGLNKFQLVGGVGKYTQDTSHYSEEGSSSHGMRLITDYGDPLAYAGALEATARLPLWLRQDAEGKWRLPYWVGPDGAWLEGAMATTYGGNQVVVPAAYLIWYNRHPRAAELLQRLAEPGDGLVNTAAEKLGDQQAAAERCRAGLLTKPGRYGPGTHIDWLNEVGSSDEVRAAQAITYSPAGPIMHYWGAKDCTQHYFNWRITGDDRFIVDSYKRVCEWFYSHDWLNAAAMPSMDRNPLPRTSLIMARLGALAANRGSSGVMYPRFALSYPQGANDIAALVTENLPDRVTARLYPFTDAPHPLQIRVWRCHGEFTVTLAHDQNDDGVPEAVYYTAAATLQRGTAVDLVLPPHQASILQITPVRTTAPDYAKADPAISYGTVELVYSDHLVVHVYNNGVKPVDDVLVRVRDGLSGEIVINGEKHTGPIEAPVDLRPRQRTVEFKNVNCNTSGSLIVELDPERQIDDLNRVNNTVVMRFRGTFDLHRGWH